MQPRSQGFFPKKMGRAGKILVGVASLLVPILSMKFNSQHSHKNYINYDIATSQSEKKNRPADAGPFPALPIFLGKKPWERVCEVVEELGFGIALIGS